jgi:hypothetical protein
VQHDTSLNCRKPFVCGQLPSSNPVAVFAAGDRYPIQLSSARSFSVELALQYREKKIRELFFAGTAPLVAGLR